MIQSIYSARKKEAKGFINLFGLIFFTLATLLNLAPINGDAATPPQPKKQSHYILVSIAPYKYFVEKIGGNTLQVGVLVPPGGSPHSYEPTAKQILAAGKADIWFRMGEGFESTIMPAIKGHRTDMQIVDLREGVDLINSTEGHCCCSHHDCLDPHVWLSPRCAKIQAETIAKILCNTYPENSQIYQQNLVQLQKELDDLDKYIGSLLEPLQYRTIMVSHPAFGYFCRDYNLHQLSVEFEGKEPTPWQLTQVLKKARADQIKKVYILEQLIGKGTRLVANNLGAQVVDLDILSENYIENMRSIARDFANKS